MKDGFLQLETELTGGDGKNLSDQDLVMNSLENPRLFEVFVDRYHDVFLRTAGKVLKSKEEAEDVVQSAFVKIYFNARKFEKRPGIAFKSWAFKILMNCSFTRYKKLRRGVGDAEYLDQLLYLVDDSSTGFDLEKKEKRDEIEGVLRQMPEDLGALIKEHYLDDRPYVEIASAKGITIPALKMKLFRARKKFKEITEQNE